MQRSLTKPYALQIENELPALRNHQQHWGADVLLREQLKNKKDTLTKADKREAGSEKQGESSRKKGAKQCHEPAAPYLKISTSNVYTSPKIATESTHAPTKHDVPHLPLVESSFIGWPTLQPYLHDCDIMLGVDRFRVFFQRHQYLPWNPVLKVHGDLVVMQVGKKNVQNIVNLRPGDKKWTERIARRSPGATCEVVDSALDL
ncbi:hypothetical protein BT96DRAFT_934939 [Gymnopus androsaceus JB14]|uniref:Uncharacterized protein n=1 Tax=Gymnopus androsaceus JB14 TaxID=1447944 RepID=A0A6A4I9I2_9AGAR|nr:hypothetical protein BT96DRAFT_934939 [Gymnopus androsaceus JB14]